MAKYVKISTPANNEVHVNSSTKNKIVTSQNQVVVTSVGTQGPAGTASTSEVFTQAVASNEWVINHSLNKKPSVTIVTATETTVVGEVTYNSNNQLTINLSSANAGKAYLN
jgi:hypothetical protein